MTEIVVRDRTMTRVIAILPAIVVALCVRILTMGSPDAAMRAAAAAVVAAAAWTAYRILTSHVRVTDEAVHVRGILYEAEVPLHDLQSVTREPAPWPVRALVWGMLHPRSVRLATSARSLRPLALFAPEDDEDVEGALRALLVRCGTRIVPSQRRPDESIEQGASSR